MAALNTKSPEERATEHAAKDAKKQEYRADNGRLAYPDTPVGQTKTAYDRGGAAATSIEGPNRTFMRVQMPLWNVLSDRYFRVEVEGWARIPDEPSLLVGVHSGATLTMDAWTLVHAWYRRFGEERILHGTAHDVLMALPGLGGYFRLAGVIPASRGGVTAALEAGHDVVVWPGGEQDAMRSWRKRDKAVLAGRKGFVRQAIRSGVPIVPVATVGGHDTVFVLSEGRWLADGFERLAGLKTRLRGETLPIIAGFPFPLALEIAPMHLPLPAKIRTEFLNPIRVDADPERAQDEQYVGSIFREVEAAIQAGMDRLAKRRRFPVFG
jgi:1-acyl-sn-glycerol-3-phosphate acyltransferase